MAPNSGINGRLTAPLRKAIVIRFSLEPRGLGLPFAAEKLPRPALGVMTEHVRRSGKEGRSWLA